MIRCFGLLKSRPRILGEALLLFALIGVTLLTTFALQSINLDLPQVSHVPRVNPAPTEDRHGVLFVRILIGIRPISVAPLYAVAYSNTLAFEPITISRSDQGDFIRRVKTNVTGLLFLDLSPSKNYQLTVNDTRFIVTIPFSIEAGRQTTMQITVDRIAYP